MKIMKAIELADGFCPNPFTREEKIGWCNEVSAILRRSVKPVYETIECVARTPEELFLPDDIAFEDVENVFADGKPLGKVDFRTMTYMSGDRLSGMGLNFSRPVKLSVVYLTRPKPVRDIEISGEFDLSENRISMQASPFILGDEVEYVIVDDLSEEPEWENPKRFYVMERNDNGITTAEDSFSPQTGAKMVMRRIIDEETEVPAPYDNMYVEYILAKMALYQHDYSGYSAHMTQYNNLFEECRREFASRRPMNRLPHFRNFW